MQLLILDDGFQHRRLARDLDIVLIDALEPWGYGHLLPRGLLREPRSALRRAGLIVITRADQASSETPQHPSRFITNCRGRVWRNGISMVSPILFGKRTVAPREPSALRPGRNTGIDSIRNIATEEKPNHSMHSLHGAISSSLISKTARKYLSSCLRTT